MEDICEKNEMSNLFLKMRVQLKTSKCKSFTQFVPRNNEHRHEIIGKTEYLGNPHNALRVISTEF